MPHNIQWIVDKRVLLTTFNGVITQEEIIGFTGEVRSLARQGTPLVHHISDSLQLERVTFSLRAIQVIARGAKMAGELGWQIDVNDKPMNKMVSNLASQFAGMRTRTFPTIAEAVLFLQRNDPTLTDATWHIGDDVRQVLATLQDEAGQA